MSKKRDNSGVNKVSLPTRAITLRPDFELLRFYEEVTARANSLRLSRGQRSNVTVQQVMLHRLRSLPGYQAKVAKKGDGK